MADLFPEPSTDDVTLEQKIKAIDRELGYRHQVYPKRVQESKMSHSNAKFQILVMESILADYKAQASQEQLERLKRKPRPKRIVDPRQRVAPLESPIEQIRNQVHAHTKCRLCHDTGVDPSTTDMKSLIPCRKCCSAND